MLTRNVLIKKEESLKLDSEMIASTNIRFGGFSFEPKYSCDNNQISLSYYPKTDSLLFFNSFIPEITITEKTTNDGDYYLFSSRLVFSVRIISSILFVFLGFFQFVLFAYFFSGKVHFGIALFIPAIIFGLAFSADYLVRTIVTNRFIERFLREISEFSECGAIPHGNTGDGTVCSDKRPK